MSRGTVVCDLDGVVYRGDEAIPGAGEALAELERMGFRLVFATNNSSRTRLQAAEKIGRVVGYQADPAQIASSATAVNAVLAGGSGTALIVGGDGIREAVDDAGYLPVAEGIVPDVVVVGIDFGLTYETLRAATTAVLGGARFIATNTDPTFPGSDGLLPGAGAIVAAIERASGRSPDVLGKPHPPMRAILREMAGDGPVWMVGDRPDTDLAMARAEGWTAVLVLTGVVADAAGVQPPPDLVLADLAALPNALR